MTTALSLPIRMLPVAVSGAAHAALIAALIVAGPFAPLIARLLEKDPTRRPATAQQVVEARDGATVLARVSRQEVTRIAFERSRVRRVTGNANEFVLEKDDERGQVFIRPADPQSTKPINLFVSSDRGTVSLLLLLDVWK